MSNICQRFTTILGAFLLIPLGACGAAEQTCRPDLSEPAGGKAIGRAFYTTKDGGNKSTRSGDYTQLELKLERVGGEAANASSPGIFQRVVAKAFADSTDEVFVGLQFGNQSLGRMVGAGRDNRYTTPVLHAKHSSSTAMQPETYDGKVVFGPNTDSEANVEIGLIVQWSEDVDTAIPGLVIQATKYAAPLIGGLPAAVISATQSLTNSDREDANKFVERALSTNSESMRGNRAGQPSNYFEIPMSDLRNGKRILVKIYDRDATDCEKQEVLAFTLEPRHRPSLLPGAKRDAANPKEMYSLWDRNFMNPLIQGEELTTPLEILHARNSSFIASLNDNGSFSRTCSEIMGNFARLGFNPDDQVALTWAALKTAAFYRDLPGMSGEYVASAAKIGPECPSDDMRRQFAVLGLAELTSFTKEHARRGEVRTGDLAVALHEARKTRLDALAKEWMNKLPAVNDLTFEQVGTRIIPGLPPGENSTVADALRKISPTTFRDFAHGSSPDVSAPGDGQALSPDSYCVAITLTKATAGDTISERTEALVLFREGGSEIEIISLPGPKQCFDRKHKI